MLKSMRLEYRVTLMLFALLAVSFLGVTALVASQARKALREEAEDKLAEIAAHRASAISVELNDAMSATRAAAKFFEGVITQRATASRPAGLKAMEQIVTSRDFYFGFWVQFIPDKYDGLDADFVNKDGYAADGGFMPYITKKDGGGVDIVQSTGTYEEYKEEAYFTIPLESKQEALMEPYQDPDAGNALMSSTCVPVFEGDEVVAVVGMDILLDKFSDIMAGITPFDTGRAFLLSQEGLYIGHPDRTLLIQPAAEHGVPAELLAAVHAGEAARANAIDSGKPVIMQVAPIKVGSAPTPWSLGIVVDEDRVMARANQMTTLVAVIGVLALLVCSLFTYITIRAIAGPIKLIVSRLQDIAEGEGDLTGRIQVQDRAEIGLLAHWFNTFVAKLQGIIQDIAGMTVRLGASSDEMALASKSMTREADLMHDWLESAASSTERASQSIQEAAHGVEDVSVRVSEVADAADTVSQNLGTVSAAVEEMSANMTTIAAAVEEMSSSVNTVAAAVEEMSASLNDVSGSTGRAAQLSSNVSEKAGATVSVVNELDQASQQIGQIVELIRGIAAQTNLLALNATIEAASAGEAGKGFAVVAHEIKELARQTATATGEISNQVASIQDKTAGTIGAIRDIIEAIQEVNSVFGSIAGAIQEQTSTVSEITRNVGYTASGANEVARNVSEAALGAAEISKSVSGANQGTAAIAEQVTHVARSAAQISANAATAAESVAEAASHVARTSEKSREARSHAEGLNSDAQALRELSVQLRALLDQFTI